eukprot:917461-Pelagomonas_calceolata.AAC.4
MPGPRTCPAQWQPGSQAPTLLAFARVVNRGRGMHDTACPTGSCNGASMQQHEQACSRWGLPFPRLAKTGAGSEATSHN